MTTCKVEGIGKEEVVKGIEGQVQDITEDEVEFREAVQGTKSNHGLYSVDSIKIISDYMREFGVMFYFGESQFRKSDYTEVTNEQAYKLDLL